MSKSQPSNLDGLRARLSQQRGRAYWRSLEEAAGAEDFRQWLQREFPRQAAVWDERMSRRDFLRLMAASLALAGLAACSPPPRETIVPYVSKPEGLVPGEPLFYATAMPLTGLGLLVESHEGRPTKVEGNPLHPASLGATDAFAQAAVLSLYDPDRARGITFRGQPQPIETLLRELEAALAAHAADGGRGLRVLTETVTSPTLAAQLAQLLDRYPNAVWHQYQPVHRDHEWAGAQQAFGQPVDAVYHLDQAGVILSLDGNMLDPGPGQVRYVRDFAARRRAAGDEAGMSRLYAVESTLTLTGAAADHRLPLRSGQVEALARAVAARLGVILGGWPLPDGVPPEWVNAVVEDLQAAGRNGLVVAGRTQPPSVHALAHALNDALGSAGTSVTYHAPAAVRPEYAVASLRALVDAMQAGEVQTLIILGGNPAYAAPADVPLAQALSNVGFSVYLGEYASETAARVSWHIAQAHFLEAWSDVRAFDGTAAIIQPLITPLYGGLSAHEVLALLLGERDATGYSLVRGFWQQQAGASDFEAFWRAAVHDGVVPGTTAPEASVSLRPDWDRGAAPAAEGLEIVFRPDPSVFDGSLANNAWLQELPKPLTKLTWDNAALMAPATAERLGLASEDVVELRLGVQRVLAPVLLMPGHAADSVTVHLGYGHSAGGRVAEGQGFNAYLLRTAGAPWFQAGLEITAAGERYPLSRTQNHHAMEGRDLVRATTRAELAAGHSFAGDDERETEPNLYPQYAYPGNRWGMAIDLSACTGCNACVVACQAENNIPVVGKAQVHNAREMHWLRVDAYFSGSPEAPETFFQPVPCMHCEQAPCEPVCPVSATVHSHDGLNDMVYNRCIGTRYCSNNCPYKVRRFNFLDYSQFDELPELKLLQNPDVTVRSRGVMEKCTYCVQRIRRAQSRAGREGRPVQDGEVLTACQGACPAGAIVFGDLNDPNSRVAALKAQPLNYALLAELNTQPRTTYLAAVRNPHPALREAGL